MFNIKESISELESNQAAFTGQIFHCYIQELINPESGSQFKTAIAGYSSPIFKNKQLIYGSIFNIFRKVNLTMACINHIMLRITCSGRVLSAGSRNLTVRFASFMVTSASAGNCYLVTLFVILLKAREI